MAVASDHPVWGEGVRALRGLYRLSQVQLAEQAGTTQVTISDLENGKRRHISDALRVRIARVLNVDPHVLFPYREGNGNGNGNAA